MAAAAAAAATARELDMLWEGCPNGAEPHEGPTAVTLPTTTTLHCSGCRHLHVRQDYGGPRPAYRHSCTHPDVLAGLSDSLRIYIANAGGVGRLVGFSGGWTDATPDWCPFGTIETGGT